MINGNNVSGYSVGFCYQASNVNFYNCYSECNLYGRFAFGFCHSIADSTIDCCYTSGNIYAVDKASGYFNVGRRIVLKNSYSNCELYCMKDGETAIIRDFTGIAASLQSSELINCYYSGIISGYYSETEYKIGLNVGIITRTLDMTTITNCHVLNNEEIFNIPVIDSNENDEDIKVDITQYKNIEEMFNLAKKLNEGLEEEVWIDIENGCPELKFKKYKQKEIL